MEIQEKLDKLIEELEEHKKNLAVINKSKEECTLAIYGVARAIKELKELLNDS